MCLSCGCGKPDDDHGDSRNITMSDLKRAAEAAGTNEEATAGVASSKFIGMA